MNGQSWANKNACLLPISSPIPLFTSNPCVQTSRYQFNIQDIRAEVETALQLPFHTDQETISIAAGSKAKLSLLLLPFAPGEYK